MIQSAVGRWRVGGGLQALLVFWLMQFECTRVCMRHCSGLFLMYGSETMIWKEKERSRIRAVQIYNLRGFLGIRRMDKVPNARIKELYRVTKGVDEMSDGVFR